MGKKKINESLEVKEEIIDETDNLKGSIIAIVSLIVGIIIIFTVVVILRNKYLGGEMPIFHKPTKNDIKITENVEVLPTMLDELSSDSAYCPTFELVWQDMLKLKEVDEIYFKPSIKIAENLNKKYFTENDIREEYYYKKFGRKTISLKKEIEKGIKDKFNQTSDILDKFDWNPDNLDGADNANRYFFYTMLYREFEYPYVFDKLDNSKFKDYDNIKYFGIKSDTDKKVRRNVRVLFYKDEDNFAISLNTKSNDEVILYKNPSGNTFESIYNNLNKNINEYKSNYGRSSITELDTVKIPYMEFNVLREYDEFANKDFYDKDGELLGTIMKAMQTIQFRIDEKGGKVKSEAAIDMKDNAMPIMEDARHYDIDDTFALFIKESDKDKPYLALRIDDIRKFQ